MKKNKYILILILTVLLSVLMCFIHFNNTVFAANSASRTIQDGVYVIKSALNEKYVVDVKYGKADNGLNIQMYESQGGNNQKFTITHLGDGYYSIRPLHSNSSLDVEASGKTNGTNIIQWKYNGTDNQKWIIKDIGDGLFNIISKANGLYLDIPNSKCYNEANVQVWKGHGGINQKFRLELQSVSYMEGSKTIDDGTYSIVSKANPEKVIDVPESSTKRGTQLTVFKNNETKNQLFNIKYLNNGAYIISNVNSQKYFDVECSSVANKTRVLQWDKTENINQQWIIKDAGDGYFYIVSKVNNLYLTSSNGYIYTELPANSDYQKFKFVDINKKEEQKEPEENHEEKPEEPQGPVIDGGKTINNGKYVIVSAVNDVSVVDVTSGSKDNETNIELWLYGGWQNQQFNVECDGEGYYTISAVHSGKALDVYGGQKVSGANVIQFQKTNGYNQKWVIKDAGNGYYSIISAASGLYLDVYGGYKMNGTNIQVWENNGKMNSQKFKFVDPNNMSITNTQENREIYDQATIDEKNRNNFPMKHLSYTTYTSKYLSTYNGWIDENKYPGYKQKLDAIKSAHPNWEIKLLTVNQTFAQAINGERSSHGKNLVPRGSAGEFVCETCGTKYYDTGWYCASAQAVAYYMDPRNFLNEDNIFQFLDVNKYVDYSWDEIAREVSGTFLEGYEDDIITACKTQGVDPLFIITRLIQENGRNGSTTSRGMYDSEYNMTFYNPFNIGASGNGTAQVLANALAKAKEYGWNSMERALEGGIEFCKANWLANCQNTIYMNKFDIDDSNYTSLYSHQYMQNLLAAYSEGNSFKRMVSDLGVMNSNFTFIIPVFQNMSDISAALPNSNVETGLKNVKIQDGRTEVRFRSSASTSSSIIAEYDGGEVFLSLKRGINSDWQYVVDKYGRAGYISGQFLTQIDDVRTCDKKGRLTGSGVRVRLGPGTNYDVIGYTEYNDEVTVIDNTNYLSVDPEYRWYRVVLKDGTQGFIAANYISM